jgi:hypothetical protein
MAKTAAQRQSEYRARRDDGEGDHRINTWITLDTHLALRRLARSYGVTRRQMLEKLINEANSVVVQSLDLDSPEWDTYFTVTR